jgi:hypothetical protein
MAVTSLCNVMFFRFFGSCRRQTKKSLNVPVSTVLNSRVFQNGAMGPPPHLHVRLVGRVKGHRIRREQFSHRRIAREPCDGVLKPERLGRADFPFVPVLCQLEGSWQMGRFQGVVRSLPSRNVVAR